MPASSSFSFAQAMCHNKQMSSTNLNNICIADEWQGSEASLSHQPHPQPIYTHPGTTSIPSMTPGYPTIMPIVPPPPDIQPIIDKLANYVAKNGPDFENIIKAKNDPRFTFVHPWNEHHKYYQYKKQLCIDDIETERRAAAAKGTLDLIIRNLNCYLKNITGKNEN